MTSTSMPGTEGPLLLEDIKVVLAASSQASPTNPFSCGTFQLSNRGTSSSQDPLLPSTQPLGHQWLWHRTAASPAASLTPITSKPSDSNSPSSKQKKNRKGSQTGPALPADSPSAAAQPSSLQDSANASSLSYESGLVEMACIAVRPVESAIHSQPSLAATKQYGEAHGLCLLVLFLGPLSMDLLPFEETTC